LKQLLSKQLKMLQNLNNFSMPKKGSLLKELPFLVVVALITSLLIKTFLVQFFYIPSGSMENTLQVQDRVAVNKVPFVSKSIDRGDVVVFRDPDNWLPEMIDYGTNKYITTAKSALVAIGVLPNPAKQYLVKRVVGVAGDRIICCTKDDKLSINGVEVDEPYIFAGNKPSDMTFDVTVPEGKIWVMGDHRGASADSRYHQEDINKGFVPVSKVTGRVVAVIWPFKNITYVPKVDVLNK
jgi:signal peptidase I